jgi:hypothetical protein
MYQSDDPFMRVVDYFLRSLWVEQPDIMQERLDRRSMVSKSFKPSGSFRPLNSAVREKEILENLLIEACDAKYHSPRGKDLVIWELYQQGYTAGEIAQTLRIGKRTVWHRLKRRRDFEKRMREHGTK